ILALAVTPTADPPKKDGEWVPLFNGKNLDGWSPKITGYALGENFGDTFRVEDGVLKVSYDKYGGKFDGRVGHLFYKHKFSHYLSRSGPPSAGHRAPGGPGGGYKTSGLMFPCQPPKTMPKAQEFPVSIEAQFLGGNGKAPRPTGSVSPPGTNIVMDGKLIPRHC